MRHEGVHQFLSPRSGPLRGLRADVGMAGYNRSHLIRYLEEAAAETVGTGSLRAGLRFPLQGGYGLSKGRIMLEGAAYVGGTAAATYGAYELGKKLNE